MLSARCCRRFDCSTLREVVEDIGVLVSGLISGVISSVAVLQAEREPALSEAEGDLARHHRLRASV
jgi:hypothetical protein